MRDLPRAYSGPLCRGRFRVSPDDFIVTEHLKEPPAGEGEHTLLEIEKVSQNSQWVARWLARAIGCPDRDVGYCGLKDRHARTRQWFSVPKLVTPQELDPPDGIVVLQALRHRRKLRLGAHARNAFCLRLRLDRGARQLQTRVDQIARAGCPNWFGMQRFGRGGANLVKARRWFKEGGRVRRDQRRFLLSAARSELFNRYLAARVDDGTWNTAQPGDVLNLDGNSSVFHAEAIDAEMARRVAQLDVHPTGPMWGVGEAVRASNRVELERAVLSANSDLMDGLERHGVRAERRALRMRPQSMSVSVDPDGAGASLQFALPPGQFATAVLHELGEFSDARDTLT